MEPIMNIRAETAADVAAITGLIERAFADQQHSGGTEQFIVRALREAGALTVSLVACAEQGVVGHVAFSPVTIGDGTLHWYGLGPVAVEPGWQRQGIGEALIRAGLARLAALGAAGCVVLGEPGYYGRFGFRQVPGLVYPGPPAEYFMALAFDGGMPQGVVAYHPAFGIQA